MWGQIAGAAVGALGSALGSSGSESTTKLPRHLRALGKQHFSPYSQEWAGDYGQGQGLWDQSRLAGQDPNTIGGQDAILGQIPGLTNQLGQATGALEGFLDYDPNSAQNMARRDAMTNNVQSMFNESIRPGIENRGTFAGQFGGNQQSLAMGSATAPLSRALADAEVAMMEGDRNRAFSAMGMAPSIFGQAATLPGQLQMGIGGMRDARSQAELQDQVGMYEAPRNNQLQSLQDINAFLSGQQGGVQTSGQQGNPIQGALGGAILGQQLGSLWGNSGGGANPGAAWDAGTNWESYT